MGLYSVLSQSELSLQQQRQPIKPGSSLNGAATHLKVFLAGAGINWNRQPVRPWWRIQGGVLIHVLQEQGRANSRSVVQPRTPISVTASPAHEQGRQQALWWFESGQHNACTGSCHQKGHGHVPDLEVEGAIHTVLPPHTKAQTVHLSTRTTGTALGAFRAPSLSQRWMPNVQPAQQPHSLSNHTAGHHQATSMAQECARGDA